MQLVIVLLVIAGAVMVYAAVKGQDPRTIVRGALTRGQ